MKLLAEQADRRPDLPPPYYRERMVKWAINLDAAGQPLTDGLVPLFDAERPNGTLHSTPYIYRSGQKPPPRLVVDTLDYVLATPKKPPQDTGPAAVEKAEREAIRRNKEYIALLHRWRDHAPDDPAASAVTAFFDNGHHLNLDTGDAAPTDTVLILVAGAEAHLIPSAVACWLDVVREQKAATGTDAVCLSCGRPGPVLNTIPEPVRPGAIPVAGGRGRDAQLVSINKTAQGRGGVIQLVNTPVCVECGGRSMAALNALLADDRHRYRTDDAVSVWWLRDPKPFPAFESIREGDPELIRNLYQQIHHRPGQPGAAAGLIDPNEFYATTLSANQSRVVVREWIDVALPDAIENVQAWFDDHAMTDRWADGTRYVGLPRLARALGRWDPKQNRYVPGTVPNLAEQELMACALRGPGRRPPTRLLPHLLQRIRADGRIDLPRASLLRLLLRRRTTRPEEDLMPDLNPDGGPAYQCGRVFAILEDIQRAALLDRATGRGPNTTIADRYFGTAMTSPLAVLTMLRKNANGHLKRLRRDRWGAYIALGDRLDDAFTKLGSEIPKTLDLAGQGQFVLGYHQQHAADRATGRAAKAAKATPPSDPSSTSQAESDQP